MKKTRIKEWLSQEARIEGEAKLGAGKPNDFMEFQRKLALKLVDLGFVEVNLDHFVDKEDLNKQLGINFYANDFPQLALSSKAYSFSLGDLRNTIPDASEGLYSKIISVLDDYSAGGVLARDLPRKLVEFAGLLPEQAIEIAEKATKVKFSLSGKFLRSSLCSAWFKSLEAFNEKYPSPNAYFSIGYTYIGDSATPTLSGAIIGGSSVNQLKSLILSLLADFNVTPSFIPSLTAYTSFIPQSFMRMKFRETFFGHVTQLSSTSLKNYKITEPVFYFEIDLLKLYRAMGKEPLSALYPQFYGEWYMSDEEIAGHISLIKKPQTDIGKEIANAIIKNAKLYSSQPAPCEFKVYEKEFENKALEVWMVGYEKSLVGPGFNNEVVVYKGSILALPTVGDHEALVNGAKTGIKIGEAVANYVASEIEAKPNETKQFQFDKTTIENANIHIPKQISSYVKHIGGDINLEAPVFMRVEARIRKLWVYRKES